MSGPVSVKVSSRHRISVPRIARERLNIQSGDRLLVDVQDGLLILLPLPENYAPHLAGLHREVWEGVDTVAYLQEERSAWDGSASSQPRTPETMSLAASSVKADWVRPTMAWIESRPRSYSRA